MTTEYKGDWYDRVYLCYEETTFKDLIVIDIVHFQTPIPDGKMIDKTILN